MASRYRLSKSRFTAGLQCHKQLWWKAHEPDAPELVPSPAQRAVFDQGTRVGEVARTYVPGGELVDAPHNAFAQRLATTKRLVERRVPAVYEASFNAGNVYAAVDILERDGNGYRLIEVKSSTRAQGRAPPGRRGPAPRAARERARRRARRADAPQPRVRLPGPCGPLRPRGRHGRGRGAAARPAGADRRPAAHARGRPPGRADRRALHQAVRVPVHEPLLGGRPGAPRQHPLPRAARRRRPDRPGVRDDRGAARRRPQRHPGAPARGGADRPADRRARARSMPCASSSRRSRSSTSRPWDSPSRCGTAATPTRQVPVQFSCHRPAPDGTIAHHEWLADGSGDPRPELARALVAACRGARTVVAYNAGFERGCIERLADAVPELADDLLAIAARLADPLPVVRAHVYHPDFHGSFSLKSVLPALVQGPASEINDSAPGGRAPHLASVGRAPRPPCDGVPHDPAPHLASVGRAPRPPCDGVPHDRAPHLASVGRAPRPPCDGAPHRSECRGGPPTSPTLRRPM